MLVEGGLVYLESPEPIAAPAELGLAPWKNGRAGAVHYQLLRKG